MPSNFYGWATLAAVPLLIIAVSLSAVMVWTSRPEPTVITIYPPRATATPAPTATREPIQVYVTGKILRPQSIHSLPYGSRVSDAVERAGGFTSDADLELVNLAGILRDGDQVHVPALGGDDENDILPTPAGGRLVQINSATLAELTTLPGIGGATAQAIIDYRVEWGPFATLDELDAVPRIGPATLENLKDLISFD